MKVAVLMGGVSSEREISLQSGKNALEALRSLGIYDVTGVDLTAESLSGMPSGVDVAFLALHGGWGENGGVQSALDALKIPYTGPGADASRIAMDKIATKELLDAARVPTAAWYQIQSGEEAKCSFDYPVVVKPPCDGSSVGISKACNADGFRQAVEEAMKIDGKRVLVEKFIPGREFTVGILPDGRALPVVEIVTPHSWYGWEEKYLSTETRYEFPQLPWNEKLQHLAVEAYNAAGCRGVVRVDFRVTSRGEAFVLELNTLPGLTSHSLVPKACAKAGISFAQLCRISVETASYG